MNSRKIYLISPREPSGATWLINCFLELGIKTYRSSSSSMWLKQGGHYRLSKHEEILKKWLPVLWDYPEISFRDDIEVEWSHTWPKVNHDSYQIIYFARDPRDSLYSRYKREAPDQSFEEFIRFPDVNTLLDKAHNWRLFNLAWMQHPNCKVFRFEDYKQDALEVLNEALEFIGLRYENDDVNRALAASTFARAAEAEVKYRTEHPFDQQLINRSGKAGEWLQGLIPEEDITYIETVCADAMNLQGYTSTKANHALQTDYSELVQSLPFLQKINLPDWIKQKNIGESMLNPALALVHSIRHEQLVKAGLPRYEVGSLLESLITLAKSQEVETLPNYQSLYKQAGLNNGISTKVWNYANRLVKEMAIHTAEQIKRMGKFVR